MHRAFLLALALASLSGCSRDRSLGCEDVSRYATADSIPPVRVPDGLSPPDESESLRLPPPPVEMQERTTPCLESPPRFFEDRDVGPGRGSGEERTPSL